MGFKKHFFIKIQFLTLFIFLFSNVALASREDFIEACKLLAKEENINENLFLYKHNGLNGLYIKSNPEYIKDPGDISFQTSKGMVHIYSAEKLFDENVKFWLDIWSIIVNKNKFIISYRTYQSESSQEFPLVKGRAVFKRTDKGTFLKGGRFYFI